MRTHWTEYAAIYAQVCAELGLAPQTLVVGDARRLAEYPEVVGEPFDLILTDPPYAQMMARPKTGERKEVGIQNAAHRQEVTQ